LSKITNKEIIAPTNIQDKIETSQALWKGDMIVLLVNKEIYLVSCFR